MTQGHISPVFKYFLCVLGMLVSGNAWAVFDCSQDKACRDPWSSAIKFVDIKDHIGAERLFIAALLRCAPGNPEPQIHCTDPWLVLDYSHFIDIYLHKTNEAKMLYRWVYAILESNRIYYRKQDVDKVKAYIKSRLDPPRPPEVESLPSGVAGATALPMVSAPESSGKTSSAPNEAKPASSGGPNINCNLTNASIHIGDASSNIAICGIILHPTESGMSRNTKIGLAIGASALAATVATIAGVILVNEDNKQKSAPPDTRNVSLGFQLSF